LRPPALIVIALAAATGICCVVSGAGPAGLSPAGTPYIRYAQPRKLCDLAYEEIDESSGLIASRRNPGVFWTHNDSGDGAKLYAFNRKGEHLGEFRVRDARNRDWEDLAAFTLGSKHYVVACDVGDNDRIRESVTLYFADEPDVDPNRQTRGGRLRLFKTMRFTYEDGPQDVEAVAIDSTSRTVCLVAKRGKRTVYALPIPRQNEATGLKAKPIGVLTTSPAVAMDISPDGRRAVVLTYFSTYEFVRGDRESWAAAFARPGRKLPTPLRRQGESVCYGPAGRSLFFTSEKLPTPLLTTPALPDKTVEK